MSALEDVAALVHRESGIAIKPSQFPFLTAAMARAAPGQDAEALLTAASDPADGQDVLDRLIDEVAVKETFFFRHERELTAVDWQMLFRSARTAGHEVLRVWSAACASGEEPYTLAIMACEAFGSSSPPVSILATDISHAALAHARRGEYGGRAVRELCEARRERWFGSSRSRLTVGPELRRLVRLRRHNLVRDRLPPPGEERFDLIVCRNVLIYFDRAAVGRTLSGLERALRSHGMLVIGAADRLAGPMVELAPRHTSSPTAALPSAGRAQAGTQPPTARTAPRTKPMRQTRTQEASATADVRPDRSEWMSEALRAVHDWSLEETVVRTGALLVRDPLNVDAYFVRGVAQLAAQDPSGAVVSLRRALYLEPSFGLAAFKLARAYEALNDTGAARRAYLRALHSLRPDDARNAALLEQLDVANVAIACRTRLRELDRGT